MKVAKLALVLVCLVDVMGQGLAFPIFNTLMMSEAVGFLPPDTPSATRRLDYGILIGVFFLAWFLGAVYISRVSDSVGRKRGILICLAGSLVGYALTLVAMAQGNFWLLIVSRAITGFTAGNQPIAQAAMMDMATDEADQARNMGLIVVGISIGLISGPIIGGVFSSAEVFPQLASLALPFYIGGGMIVLAFLFVALFFKDTAQEYAPLRIQPLEIFYLLWEITRRPLVMRVTIVYFFYMMCFLFFYVFFDDFLSGRYDFDTARTSLAMFILGVASAVAGLIILPFWSRRASKMTLIIAMTVTEIVAIAAFVFSGSLAFVFAAIAILGIAHAVAYPTFLTLFSQAAGPSEQGWVMGVSTALFTLAAAVASFFGGTLSETSLAGPFLAAMGAGAASLVLLALVWRERTIRELATAR